MTDNSAPSRVDRRVRRTREAIRAALMELMTEKDYEAVTVADIITRADIGRSTFYTHFTDKQQVLHDSLQDLAAFLRAHRADRQGQLFGFSRAMFEHVHEQRVLLRALIGQHGGTAVHRRIQHHLADLVREDLEATGRPVRDVPVDLVVDFVVGSYLSLMSRWVDEAEPRSPQEMDDAFRRLVIPGVQAVLQLRG
jgi:AcrR family transcriptional regulator